MKETTVTLVANGRGGQTYFGGEFLNDSACPLRQGQECTARAIPGVGILLTPVHDTHDYQIVTEDDQPEPEVTPDV